MRKQNYKIPPVSTSDTVAMLRFFGVNAVESDAGEKDGVLRRSSLRLSVFDPFRLPKIFCPLTNNPYSRIIISFPGPPSFGLQSFSFDPETLLNVLSTIKNEDVSAATALSAICGYNSPFLTFVFEFFPISPSTLNRVYNRSRGYSKTALNPSLNKVKSALKTE